MRSLPRRWLRRVLPACAAALAAWGAPAAAHTLRPAIVEVTFRDDGTYRIAVQENLEAILAGIGPQHEDTREAPTAGLYDRLRRLPPEALRRRVEAELPRLLAGIRVRFDGRRAEPALAGLEIPPVGHTGVARTSTLVLEGTVPAGTERFSWSYAEAFGDSALRVRQAGSDEVRTAWLPAGTPSGPFAVGAAPAPAPWYAVAAQYLSLGFTHILPKGLDHILFVLGIFLLSLQLRPILWQVTAFTVAHTITLGLTVYGVFSLPATVVEPLIALSIVYVGLENAWTPRLQPWRPAVVFGFGLLHGMGFAGVLGELGLPRSQFLTALLGFNAGVELGQLAVIAGAFAAVGLWFRRRRWYRARVVIPASLAISAVGLYWTVERVL